MFLFTNIPPPPILPQRPEGSKMCDCDEACGFGKDKKTKDISCESCRLFFIKGIIYTLLFTILGHIGLAYILLI